jgi:hypothetical protein
MPELRICLLKLDECILNQGFFVFGLILVAELKKVNIEYGIIVIKVAVIFPDILVFFVKIINFLESCHFLGE